MNNAICALYNYRRFGSFEIFKTQDPITGRSGPSVGRTDILHQLLDYTTSTFYPEVLCIKIINKTELFNNKFITHVAHMKALWY